MMGRGGVMGWSAALVVQWVGVVSVGLLVGCSGEAESGETGSGVTPYERLQQLEACSAPVPCAQLVTYVVGDAPAACLLDSMSTGELGQHRVVSSVTGDDRQLWDLFVSTDRGVQVVYREIYNEVGANWDDPNDYHYTLSACTLRPTSFFDDCLGASPIDGSCLDPDTWVEQCTALSEVHCP